MSHPAHALRALGQSIWFDDLSRRLVESGELARMVREDGLAGITSNPAIFQKALAAGEDYSGALAAAVAEGVEDAKALYEHLAVQDVQAAADVLRPVYDAHDGADGFVSLEVSPHLADDTEATVAEARRLWKTVDRPNLMVKVPGTEAGLPAIETLLAEGISVNVTLLFSVDRYAAVLEAHLRGLERLLGAGGDPARVASVASFFVSRIDSAVDRRLEERAPALEAGERREAALALRGRAAIANARLAFVHYQETLAGERWQALADRGARPQRLLWASTSTKNPAYPATLYVDALAGPGTVNTLPRVTYEALAKGRAPEAKLGPDHDGWERDLAEARSLVGGLSSHGVSLSEVTEELLDQGVVLFADAFDGLLADVEARRQEILGPRLARQQESPGEAAEDFEAALEDWRREGRVRRLWARRAEVWTGADEARWLGWLDAVARERSRNAEQAEAVTALEPGRFDTVLLLGMGGSSLCPDVLARTFGPRPEAPTLRILDSTVPAQIARTARSLDPARTLVAVASKSGGTVEPNLLMRAFAHQLEEALGSREAAAAHFVAITDPGSALESHAKERGFAAIALGEPDIGGRFSALSPFGLWPARMAGLPVPAMLDAAAEMVRACGPASSPASNPGVRLGLLLGSLARRGRDKLTLLCSPGLESLGGWLEQLVAESTGKRGTGIVPVDGEVLTGPDAYGDDRVFVSLRLDEERDPEADAALATLESAGHPVVRIALAEREQLFQEFFRWEMATAVAGAVLGVNPFDQPDVEAAKVASRELLAAYESGGGLPEEPARFEDDALRICADPGLAGDGGGLGRALAAHLARLGPGDYFAVNAFLDLDAPQAAPLQALRHAVRDRRRVATTLGFGPRFLHSTGQLHKGGPGSGVFLMVTADDAEDWPVPGQRASFGVLARAQAQGDFRVLAERRRRVLWVHLKGDLAAGLEALRQATLTALEGGAGGG